MLAGVGLCSRRLAFLFFALLFLCGFHLFFLFPTTVSSPKLQIWWPETFITQGTKLSPSVGALGWCESCPFPAGCYHHRRRKLAGVGTLYRSAFVHDSAFLWPCCPRVDSTHLTNVCRKPSLTSGEVTRSSREPPLTWPLRH